MPVFKVHPPIAKGSSVVTVGGPGNKARLLLGKLAELGPRRDLWLDLDREHVVAVVGKRGSGKTHTLGVLMEGLADSSGAAGLSKVDRSRQHAIVIFDTLNLFQWVDLRLVDAKGPSAERQRELLRRWSLEPIQLAPTFWHPLGSEPATSRSTPFSINTSDMDAQDWGRLLDVDIVAEPMGQLLNEAFFKVKRNSARYEVDDLIALLRSDPDIQRDFAPETNRAVRQRLAAFARSPLFDSKQTDWTAALKPGHVAVFLLGRVHEDLRSVLVFLVIRRLLELRAAASETAKHSMLTGSAADTSSIPPTWLIVDEAQNILPSRNATAANDILTRFVREGRNFGLSLAISTQQPNAIDPRVMAQVDTLIAHTLTVRTDVNYVLSNLKSADPESIGIGAKEMGLADSVRLLDAGQCLVSSVDSQRLVFCDVRPRLTVHGGFEA